MLKRFYSEIKLAFLENKTAIHISFFVLIFSLILGYLLEPYLYSYFNPVVDDLTQKVETGVIKLTFGDIFINNISIIIQMFIYGLLFCLCIFLLAYNGFFIGYYAAIQDNLFRVLAMMIPHGIFELPSCALACASGLVLFNFLIGFFKSYIKKDLPFKISIHENIDKLKQSAIIFSVSVILMIIAGIVEVYLTVPIANFILGI